MPADAVSGVYIAKLVRNGGGANHIPFIVRDDDGNSDVLFQTADTTWQAYNDWGGNSLYSGSPAGRAYKVSYNRPINTRFGSAPGQPEDFLFDSEYPTIRFLEANGYDVCVLLRHRQRPSRRRDPRARHLPFGRPRRILVRRPAGERGGRARLRASTWRSSAATRCSGRRAGKTASTAPTRHRTLVSYKETHPTGIDDPTSQATGTWRDPRFETDAGRPENALTGQIFMVNDGSDANATERRSRCRWKTASCDSGATPVSARPPRPSPPKSFPTSGTKTSTTARGLRG